MGESLSSEDWLLLVQGITALGTLAVAVVTLFVALAAWSTARLTRREFELSKHAMVDLECSGDVSTCRDGKTELALFLRIRETTGIPTTLHRVRDFLWVPPPGWTQGSYTVEFKDRLTEPVRLHGDHHTWSKTLTADVTERLVHDGNLRVTVDCEFQFSIEGDDYVETWQKSFLLEPARDYRDVGTGNAVPVRIQAFSPQRFKGRHRLPGRFRKTWQRWKKEMGLPN